jgi:hypothetical protein
VVDRVSLRNLIDASKRLDELGIARIVANAAELVHKQQKGGQPLNMLTPDAVTVAQDGGVSVNATAAKAAYTAPERLRDEAGDRRSDVFSLGAILWEALAGEPLFQGEVEGEIKAAVLEGEYRSVTETNANVPSELDAICKKALAKTPADRFPSCKVMAAEIATVLDDAGYPEENDQIVEYLATKYTPPAPKAEPEPTSRPTPLPVETIPANAPATQTLQGIAPRAEIDAAKAKLEAEKAAPIEVRPPILPESPLRPKSPTPAPAEPSPSSTLPSWATSRPPAAGSTPPENKEISPSATLPGMPSILNTPAPAEPVKSFSKTAVLGSMSSAELALPPVEEKAPPPPEPSQPTPIGKKTEVLGSQSVADRLAAINASVPGLPSVPPGADPSLAPKPAPNITTAETVATPSLAKAEANAAAALEEVSKTPPPSTQDEALPHPANAVALPRPQRPGSEADKKADPLRGWGWGTDSHPSLEAYKPDDDDEYYEQGTSAKKRLVMAIGGAAAVLVLVVVAAFAFRGGKKDEEKKTDEDVAAKNVEPAVDWSQPTEPPPEPTQPAADPGSGSGSGVDVVSSADLTNAGSAAAPDPNAGSASSVDPNAAAMTGSAAGSATAEPPNVEPESVAKTEPPKTEPPKTEPPKTEPPKTVAKTEPPKKETPKTVAKTEPKKETPKKTARLPDPKPARNTGWDPLSRRPPKDMKPVDPYAEPVKNPASANKVDANAAYKTGIQQFARGDANGALATFKASLQSNPEFAPTWRGIGMVYEKLGKRGQAKTAFRKYLALSPNASDAEQIRERMGRL